MSTAPFHMFKVGLDDTFDIEKSGERAELDPEFVNWLNEVYGPIYTNIYYDPEIDNGDLFHENIHYEFMKRANLNAPEFENWRGIAFAYPHEAYQMEVINAVFRMITRGRDVLFLLHAPIGSEVFNYAMRYAREIVFLASCPFLSDNDGALADNNFLMLMSYTRKTAFSQRNSWASVTISDWKRREHIVHGVLVRK